MDMHGHNFGVPLKDQDPRNSFTHVPIGFFFGNCEALNMKYEKMSKFGKMTQKCYKVMDLVSNCKKSGESLHVRGWAMCAL